MPLYEYECPAGHGFSTFNSISNRATAVCPEHGIQSNKRISKPILLGEGSESSDQEEILDALHHPENYTVGKLIDKTKEVQTQIANLDKKMRGAISKSVAELNKQLE